MNAACISGWMQASQGLIQSGTGWFQIGIDIAAAAYILRRDWLNRKRRRR